ncbi:MAG: c-type cytochrome [Pseudomonadota bacterium]
MRLAGALLYVGLCGALIARAAGAPDAQAGREKSASERCQECHGEQGQGTDAGAHPPRLAGQDLAYLIKQLRDFKSGARKNDLMTIMARSVDDADLADIAAHFSAQPRVAGDGGGQGGAALYAASCAACHGAGGAVPLAGAPRLQGQNPQYLARQLRNFRNGQRANGGAMEQVSAGLSDDQITALSAYLAGS